MWWRPGRDAAGKRRIVVDVEFQEVEEGISYERDCAVEFWELLASGL